VRVDGGGREEVGPNMVRLGGLVGGVVEGGEYEP